MTIDYEATVPEHWRQQLAWDTLPQGLRDAIGRFGMASYQLGQQVVNELKGVKYGGRLVILEDGTRWEVNASDADKAATWQPSSKVAVIRDEMFSLEGVPFVRVRPEEI